MLSDLSTLDDRARRAATSVYLRTAARRPEEIGVNLDATRCCDHGFQELTSPNGQLTVRRCPNHST